MNSEKMTFRKLIEGELKLAESNRDAELAAILTGALYAHGILEKIINTKMTSVCPSIASEAYTLCNELAENVERIRNEQSQKSTGTNEEPPAQL